MTEALDLRESDRVLEVGTGSGYQTSILSLLAREVFTVEIFPELACGARTVLETGGHRNIRFRTADGRLGWPEEAPFDAILLTAAPARLPRALLDQLGLGGRLVAPVGDLEQRLDIWRRSSSGKIDRTHITSVRFVPLLGEGP
jgi:protein-L-isoaspartate(D-aspartate) O-methyltransferase